MGCDIHIYTEVYKDNKWIQIDPLKCSIILQKQDEKEFNFIHELDPSKVSQNYYSLYVLRPRPVLDVDWKRQIYRGRNYELFGLLAGIRYFEDPIIPPRGLPDDMSDTLRDIADHYYEHTGHWYTLSELLKKKTYSRSLSFFFSRKNKRSVINKLKQKAKKHKVNSKQIRIVFWFDS